MAPFLVIIKKILSPVIFVTDWIVWYQVMTNEEAVDCIKHIKDAKSAAKLLAEEALTRKSSDDISCIVVKLQ